MAGKNFVLIASTLNVLSAYAFYYFNSDIIMRLDVFLTLFIALTLMITIPVTSISNIIRKTNFKRCYKYFLALLSGVVLTLIIESTMLFLMNAGNLFDAAVILLKQEFVWPKIILVSAMLQSVVYIKISQTKSAASKIIAEIAI